ncbi:ciliogenesis and planar polarity effector 1-like [Littorina saxatilis]|uniref:Uncharacterized protein n=1 Tax=Littorina saxatilis TaxID=31220 RepID=A0AAN9BA41_9CAEN
MKIELEVIASTSIKRRKPWPRIVWVGTKQQSLLMLDKQRVSVLYIPSGKTKRKISHISNVVTSAISMTTTTSGGDLVGLLDNGDIFVWNKDGDKLHTVCGLAPLLEGVPIAQGSGQVFASDDCSKVLVVVHRTKLFLWQRDTNHTYLEGQDHTLVGRWSRVAVPEGMVMPAYDCPEACLHAMFASSSLLGDCCDVSMVFNSGSNMTICSVLIRFQPADPMADTDYPSVHSQWKCVQYPLRNISSGCEAINIQGAYVPRYSTDASILAVAVNQKSPADTSMLFVSPVTDMLLLSAMRGCGVRDPETKRGKSYWVNDLAWVCDNLFVACILGNGSAALLSRLGEPMAVATHGCSVEMGPAYFLPLHPLITVQGEEGRHRLEEREFEPSSAEDNEPLQQVFSVSSHPSLPILVFSDGYMVTFTQLPGDLSAFVFMRNLVLESSKHLKEIGNSQNVELTVANAYNLPVGDERVKASPRRPKTQAQENKHFSFEELNGSLNETIDSEVSTLLHPDAKDAGKFGAVQNANAGKIVFGEPDLLQSVLDTSDLRDGENSLMKSVVSAKHDMLLMWKVAASSTEPWTANVDGVVKKLVDNLVKLFSVILDCPPVSQALERQQQSQPASAVQTASLYQVISLYRHLLEVAQFDALQQHLAPSILQLAHLTMATVLESRTLQASDPRLKTLSGCFTLLKFTEKTLNNLYVWLPKSLHKGNEGGHRALGDMFEPLPSAIGGGKEQKQQTSSDNKQDEKLAFDTAQLVAKRLAGSWKALYKAVLSFEQGSLSELNHQQARQLLFAIQQSLQAINATVPHNASVAISRGDKLSLDGKHTLAMNAWKEQLRRFQETGNDAHAAKLLHSLLYTHLLKVDLLSAVELIDSLVVEANVQSAIQTRPLTQTPPIQPSFMTFVTNTLKSQAFHEPDMVPCIRDKAIRQVVQTLARFMAAYFSNQTVYIFPPHNPQPLPAIHFQASILNNRILPKYHEEISAMVRQQKLSSIWTVERALEYLLLSGLVCEAAWFADQMGNWKTAFQLATACSLHRVLAPRLYHKQKRPLMLPEELQPDEILYRKLECLAGQSPSGPQAAVLIDDRTDMTQLSATLEDIMMAGVMGRVEVAPRILSLLVSRLKAVVKQFHPLVPTDFYLPAPPLYCPQPAHSAKVGMTPEVQSETSVRRQASSLIQLTLAVMNAAHVSIPAVRWYLNQLADAQPKATQFKTNTEGPCQNFPGVLLDHLSGRSEFKRVKGDLSIHSVLVSFRDLCSLLWMLHTRDSLSQSLRKREQFLGRVEYDNSEKSQWEDGRQSEWLSLCWASLRWAAHLLPYTRFLADEASVHKVLVSMLLELAPSTQVADLMAEFFHDTENFHPELQERLDKVLAQWQTVIVKPEEDNRSVRTSQDSFDGRKSVTFRGASPRGESLSVYFLKQQQVAKKVLKKKQRCYGYYEEYVFARGVEPPKKLFVGARPFETKISYFDFLDMFCSVSFSKVLDKLQTKDKASSLPLLTSMCGELINQEMNFFVKNIAAQAHKRHDLLILAGSVAGSEHYASQDDLASESRRQSRPGAEPAGLFRGKSILDHSLERYHASVVRENGEPHSNMSSPRQPRLTEAAANQNWKLTVNFGKRYTRLQQLLEWLELWSNKHHKFGLGRQESLLELKPSMKLQIPAQLIVLSLWLLENKYSSKSTQSPRLADMERGRQRGGRGNTLRMSASLSPSDVRRGGNKRVSPARGRGRSRSGSGSPMRRGLVEEAMMQARNDGMEASLPQSTLRDAQEVRTAYEQVLDGPDDSSSLVVSSLASDELPDELQRTSNALRSNTGSPSRGENSALNHVVYMDRVESPFERPRNPSPAPRSSTPPSHRSAGTSPVRSPPVPSPRSHVRHRRSLDDSDVQLAGGEGGLAQMLQVVIRKEMRRIVQIQQHSLNAMMGAIDNDDLSDPHSAASQRDRSQQPVHHALSELQNLQQQHVSPTHGSRFSGRHTTTQEEVVVRQSAGPLHMSHLSAGSSRSQDQENRPPTAPPGIPGFLRIAAEREEDGFRLPIIPPPPHQAWSQEGGGEGGRMHFPLLRLSEGPPQPGVYAPPPPPRLPGASFMPPPPPSFFPTQPQPLSFQHVPPQVSRPQEESLESSGGLIGIPLLRMPPAGFSQTSQEPLFGRLVPPEYLTAQMKEKEQEDAAKQRHLQGFHEQMAEKQWEAERAMREKAAKNSMEKRAAVRRVRAKPKPPKPKTPSPPQSTETEEGQGESEQAKAEATEEEEQEQSVDEELDDSTIHDGYAIPPGVFEGYQHLEQDLGVEVDQNTRFQYKMAQAMRRQLEKEKERWIQQRKVDFATNTRNVPDAAVDTQLSFESVRTAEAATAITRDAGVDPVHDAIAEYNRSRQGIAVPPDVYLGLRFADGQEETSSAQAGKAGGRAFLNVVDVQASAILRDIPEHDRARDEAEVKPAAHLARDTSPHRMGELEESLRAQLEPTQRRHHDAVTVSLFQRRLPGDDRMSVALLPRDSTRDSKTALVQRLRTMNDQMTAMDEMSRNMENDFHNSKMLLETLQTMNDTYQPAPGQYMDQQHSDPTRLSAERLAPKTSHGSPSTSARVSARSARDGRTPSPAVDSRRSDGSPRHDASRASHLSGMSDISDIIGEVLAEGGVDLTAAGLTPEEAEMYAARARQKHKPRSPMTSYDELKIRVKDGDQDQTVSAPSDRREIHRWMTEKYAERQTEYNQRRLELAEREAKPYKPSAQMMHMGTRDLRHMEENREQRKHDRERQDMRQRIMEAEYLIGSALTEVVETKRDLSRSRSPSPRSRSISSSPVRSPRSKSKSSASRSVLSTSPQRRDVRGPVQRMAREPYRPRTTPASAMDQTFNVAAPPRGILKASQSGSDVRPRVPSGQPIMVQPAGVSSDFDMTGGSSADLRDYMSAIQDLDSSEEVSPPPRRQLQPRTRPEPIPEKPQKVYKPKPFTEMVRMQRPHVTRQQSSQEAPDEKYVKQVLEEKAAQKAADTARSRTSAAEKTQIQRSKGADSARKAYAPIPKPTTPRRVKTYTERLQEMKPSHKYASPIIPRQHVLDSVRSASTAQVSQRKPTGPPHKPMTYVQQLKKINREATITKQTGRRGRTAAAKTRMPTRAAPHRPKTYTEQLKELNAPFKKTYRSTARAPSSLGSSRPRPYGDPYSEEAASVLSDWSMDDDVRKLLYDDADAFTVDGTEASASVDHLMFAPSEAGASDYYEAIMGGSDPDNLGFDYRESVDVSELERIAEVASVGSGSVLSVIDWDAVDKLIEDV